MTVKTKPQTSIKRTQPAVYLVYIIGEKYIPWDFSMRMLMNVFHKTPEEARAIADEIQVNGEGICGAYIYEIAETKAVTVERQANKERFSLQCLLEEV
jgi:ATP-dependent Clp protease adaptor protein ClpS